MVVKATPERFHSVTPDLVVKGASDAIEFYKRAFGAVENYRHNSPDGNSIVHAELKIGDSIVMLSDEFNQAVAAGATVTMPLMDMFWGDRYGQLEDPFGHFWSIATHKEDLTPEQIEKAGAEIMMKMMDANE